MENEAEEKMIKEFLSKKGLCAEYFNKEEKRKSKTPDFRVFKGDECAFFCEVKTILSDERDGLRKDPIYNRLTDDIHTAVKQFDAVNPNLDNLNVLVFVNHDVNCGFNDLLGVLTGKFYSENGSSHFIYGQYSNGRIREEKNRIHLFYWKDDYLPERFLFTDSSDRKVGEMLCKYFDLKFDEIKEL